MAYEFLSEPWFAKVEELVAAAGDLGIPAAMSDVEVNVTVTGGSGVADVPFSIKGGVIQRGHRDGAPTTVTLSRDLARKLFVEADAAAGMQAFFAGQIKVEGDMAKLLALQTAQPSASQQALGKQIAAVTA